jgi:hypothetical protein
LVRMHKFGACAGAATTRGARFRGSDEDHLTV